MKKALLSICLAFISIGFGMAQGGTTYFGLKGGMSLSGYHGGDWDTTKLAFNAKEKSRSSFTGALAVNSHVGEWVILKHEFWVTNKGSILETASGDEISYNRWYLDLAPIQIGVNLKGFQAFAGPQAGLMLFKKDEYRDSDGKVVFSDEDQEGEAILDYGFIAGSEYEFPFGLNIGVRYIQGFHGRDEDGDLDWKNNQILISAGFTFGKDY